MLSNLSDSNIAKAARYVCQLGPTWPPGIQGPQGVAGPAGATGPPGKTRAEGPQGWQDQWEQQVLQEIQGLKDRGE